MMNKIRNSNLISTCLKFKTQSTYHQHQHHPISVSAFHSQSKYHQTQPPSTPPPQEDLNNPNLQSPSTSSEPSEPFPSSSSSTQSTSTSTDQPRPPPTSTPKPNEIPNPNLRSQLTEFTHKRLQPIQILLRNQLKSTKEQLSNELSSLPNKLSKLTGYGEIDELKSIVTQKESNLKLCRQRALEMKQVYNAAAECRSESVREVNDLLARKASWSDGDLARFTTLVRTDHSNEQEELKAKVLLEEAEAKVDQEFTGLMQAILSRYHEEQVWSDKIRSLSTTFSLSITLINVLVFLAAIVLVEPYKRAKVVEGVETRMIARDEAKSDLMEEALKELSNQLNQTDSKLLALLQKLESDTKPTEMLKESSQVNEDPMIDFRSIEPTFEEETIEIETPIECPDSSRPTDPSLEEEVDHSTDQTLEPKEEEDWKPSSSRIKGWWYEKYEEIQSDPELCKQVEIGAGLSFAVLLIGIIHMYSSK